MQLSSRKTWSQEVLALSLHPAGPRGSGFLTFEKRASLLLAVKTAIAAGICYWLARLAGLQDGYWGSISAIIVLQSNVGSTVTASRDRLIGTLIGAAYGAAFSFLGTELWSYRHHSHAGAPDWFQLDAPFAPRTRSAPGNRGGIGDVYIRVPEPRADATSRRAGAGVFIDGRAV